ncbi:MAG: hypothetical protein WC295_02060 [Methanoregula sp.]
MRPPAPPACGKREVPVKPGTFGWYHGRLPAVHTPPHRNLQKNRSGPGSTGNGG